MNKSVSKHNPLKGSICGSCKYLVERVIIPFNEAEYGIDREALGIPEDQDVVYEHYTCEELAIDLDHIVLECNRYKSKVENSLLKNKF